MNIKDWPICGQLWSAQLDIQIACRDQLKNLEVGPQILTWLLTSQGRSVLSASVAGVAARWKIETEAEHRVGQVTLSDDNFESLVQGCNFESRDVEIIERNFSSRIIDHHLVLKEEAFEYPIQMGTEAIHLRMKGLRPAQPIEFLEWLRCNRTAGIATTIHCVSQSWNGNYMASVLGGKGGRGLHRVHFEDNIWPPASVFLGVK